jgi:hypothetical protein
MAQKSQSVTFDLASPEPRAWVVVKTDNHEPLVVEMRGGRPNHWSANIPLTPGEYRCRFYCGDERNVVYSGPASISGSAQSGMDAVIVVGDQQEEIVPKSATILLVEDDIDSLKAYTKILRMIGHTVARIKRISVEQRAESAVIAWMRHKTTGYDDMTIQRVKGKRREVRRMLAQRSHELLAKYRRGDVIGAGCPLLIAVSGQQQK